MSEAHKGKHYNSNNYKLTTDEVINIKKLLILGVKPSIVSKKLGINYKEISRIYSSDTYNYVEVHGWNEFFKNRKKTNRLKKEDYLEIYNLYISGKHSIEDIAIKYNKHINTIKYAVKKVRESL